MKPIYLTTLLLVSLLATRVSAQITAQNGSVSDIKFIEGHWKAIAEDGRAIEAVWLGADGDNMLGFVRMMNSGKADLYEMLAYEQSDGRLVSLVKHFKPGLLGQEEKDNPNRYVFVEASKDRAIFETPAGDLRILYEKRSPNRFAIARGNKDGDKWIFKDLFVFDRVK